MAYTRHAKKPWQDICAEVQKRRDDSVAAVDTPEPGANLPLNVIHIPAQLLTQREIEITETLPEKLLPLLASGSWSSLEVTNAFLRRAGLAQKLVNCITELLPERSRSRAKELDDYLQKNGKPIGPLHGLPISVKELVGMKGIDVHISFCSWVGNIMDDDAVMIKLLEQAGAVFHARTTEPQAAMHLETSSNLFGVTVNPYNRKLTSGGSSGGEGALIGLFGSCLGIGSDIGGSIRNPAANNGIFGLRPTTYRLPIIGFEGSDKALGFEQIVPVAGPLSSSIEGIKVFMKALIDSRPWLLEPSLVPIPWRQESFLDSSNGNKSLKVGVLWHDGVVKPHPPILRALSEIAGKLKHAPGIEIVDWKPYKHDYAWEIIASLYFPDGAQTERDAIEASGEPWMPLTDFIVKENPHVKRLDIEGVWDRTSKREIYRAEYSEHWNKTATGVDKNGHLVGMVDVILCPVGPGVAAPLNCSRYWGYTSQWNLLDYPGLAFPVSTVDPAIDLKDTMYNPINEQDKYNHELYEPERYIDAPISLQLVGRRHEDEKVIQAYEVMQKYF